MAPAHKPRKRKDNDAPVAKAAPAAADAPSFVLMQLLSSGRRTSQWVLLPLILMIASLFRWSLGFWGYSGFGKPPMHGDFEAQRHWMEITAHLPIAKWYFYDLGYWGLDYPPLTAYHSWLLGKLGSLLNPSWFALDASRGLEDPALKVYMRATVLLSEYYIYVPPAILLFRQYAGMHGASRWESSVALVAFLMQPATMLVDHGHFQYNTVMLGFVLSAVSSFFVGRYSLGCVFFVCALCFKQMALYYAPAVFAYLLGICIFPRLNVARFLRIAISTTLTFAVIFAPIVLGAWYNHQQDPTLTSTLEPPHLFALLAGISPIPLTRDSPLYTPALHLTQSIHRIFPLARGLFEDKVANFWCGLHTMYKLHDFSVVLLSRVSLLATLAAIAPASITIFLMPKRSLLPLALASCAWAFFLFSFQVHEKSVLLPLLPMTVLLAGGGSGGGAGSVGIFSAETRAWVGFANMLGTFTLYPLLKRDGLSVPYAVLTLLWAFLMGLPPLDWTLYRPDRYSPSQASEITAALHVPFYVLGLVWHGCEALVAPMEDKPDLWVVLNCLGGLVGFALCYLWCTGMLVYRSGLLTRAEAKGKVAAGRAEEKVRTMARKTEEKGKEATEKGKRAGTPKKGKS